MKSLPPRIGIVDYGVGNVRSVGSAIEKVGGQPILTSNHRELMSCDRLVLPGVGAFAHGMAELEKRGLVKLITHAAEEGVPILGICLGMQLLAKCSHEFGKTFGLSLVDGIVTRLSKPDKGVLLRLPHVAWKQLRRMNETEHWLFDGLDVNASFYFIHSYAIEPNCHDQLALSDHDGVEFTAIVARDNVIGTQFHPEKSGEQGLQLLRNFVIKGK